MLVNFEIFSVLSEHQGVGSSFGIKLSPLESKQPQLHTQLSLQLSHRIESFHFHSVFANVTNLREDSKPQVVDAPSVAIMMPPR
jgi:hypothetical protein